MFMRMFRFLHHYPQVLSPLCLDKSVELLKMIMRMFRFLHHCPQVLSPLCLDKSVELLKMNMFMIIDASFLTDNMSMLMNIILVSNIPRTSPSCRKVCGWWVVVVVVVGGGWKTMFSPKLNNNFIM